MSARRARARDWNPLRDALLPGALAGTVGAVAMALLACGAVGVLHGAPWRPALLVAGTFFRAGAPLGTGTVVLGLLLHFALAGALATGFALVLPRGGTAVAALMLGLLYSLVLWSVMTEWILPFASPPLDRAHPGPLLLALHLAFGAALGTLPAARARFRPRAR
ncbi:hypothetical protein DRW03_17150 [Corallococcus sp. H22C18031201]|uniref:hypothetical protein n=1 Tax=Citreicoccus inhibens TaxID=2849499 RepID=UPI000E7218CA|nr:hypothetical protein [Citreicoccus inhibens]MBU8897296.1 hypothetical protein [Citreicoccus inhibens]RJS21144.1 hypothetical protein DRW03_17150 [Corallococcus sp. H22C18031201]